MRYRSIIDFEADNNEAAMSIRDEAMQYFEGIYIDGELEVQVNEDRPDEMPKFEPIEGEEVTT